MKNPNYIIRVALAGLSLSAVPVVLFGQAVTPPADAASKPAAVTISVPVAAAPAPQEQAGDGGDDVVLLEAFHVQAKGGGSYIGSETTAGTRIATDIIDMPFAVQVLSKDFIEDFQLYDLNEQANYIGGMAPEDPANPGDMPSLRGFSTPVFRNGFRRSQRPESNSIRQTEVIRGPQSALFGRAAPGGVVNVLSKLPQSRFKTGASAIWGSYDYQTVNAYVTGPLIRGKLFYRVDMEYYDRERNTDFYFMRTTNISGGVMYRISQNTSLSAEFEHTKVVSNDYTNSVFYIERFGTDAGDGTSAGDTAASVNRSVWQRLPIYMLPDKQQRERLMRFNANGSERRWIRENDSYYLQLNHRFAPDISMKIDFGYSKRSVIRHSLTQLSTWDPARNNGLGDWGVQNGTLTQVSQPRNAVHYEQDYDEYGVQANFTKNWRTSIKQSTLLSFDYFREKNDLMEWEIKEEIALRNAMSEVGIRTESDWNDWRLPNPFNLNPKYSLMPSFGTPYWSVREGSGRTLPLPGQVDAYADERYMTIFKTDIITYGALMYHSMSFWDDRVFLIGALRQDYAEVKREYPYNTNVYLQDAAGVVSAMTYSTGVSVRLLDKRIVGFLSYGKSFNPTPTVDPNVGTLLGNLTANGFDGGFKGIFSMQGGRQLRYTVSLYSATQENEVVDNPEWLLDQDNRSVPRYIEGGSRRGTGMSVEVAGDNFFLQGLRLNGQFSLISMEMVKWPGRDDPSKPEEYMIGTRPVNIPARTFGAGASYRFQKGLLKPFGVGVTYTYVSERLRAVAAVRQASQVWTPARYTPPQSLAGGFISFTKRLKGRQVLSVSVNFINITNDMTITQGNFMPNGREFRGTLRIEF